MFQVKQNNICSNQLFYNFNPQFFDMCIRKQLHFSLKIYFIEFIPHKTNCTQTLLSRVTEMASRTITENNKQLKCRVVESIPMDTSTKQSMPKTQATLLKREKKDHKSQMILEFVVSLSPSNTRCYIQKV